MSTNITGFNGFQALLLTAVKKASQFLSNLEGKSRVRRIFDGEMFIQTLLTTLLEFFCKIILVYEVKVKSTEVSDNIF